jgi:hypothetical protein
LENVDIWSITDELLKSGYLIFLEIDQKVLSERRADVERIQGTAGNERTRRTRSVDPGPCKSVDIDVMEVLLLPQDGGIGDSILLDDLELDF